MIYEIELYKLQQLRIVERLFKAIRREESFFLIS